MAQASTPRAMGDHHAPHLSPAFPSEDLRTIQINKLSWGAVLAGVAVSLVTQILLNMLGIGVGVATLDPAGGDNPAASTFSISAGVWWTISGIIAAFVGGYVAGRLSGRPKESTTALHGLTAWAVTTLLVVYFLTTTAGALVGGVMSTVSGAVGGLGQAAMSAAAPAAAQSVDPFGAIERQIRESTGGNDPAALRDAAVASIRAAMTGDEAQAQEARERAAQALAQARGVPIEQARQEVTQYEQQYRQTVDQARQTADDAATVISSGALLATVALMLGAVAGWLGGRLGKVEPTLTM